MTGDEVAKILTAAMNGDHRAQARLYESMIRSTPDSQLTREEPTVAKKITKSGAAAIARADHKAYRLEQEKIDRDIALIQAGFVPVEYLSDAIFITARNGVKTATVTVVQKDALKAIERAVSDRRFSESSLNHLLFGEVV